MQEIITYLNLFGIGGIVAALIWLAKVISALKSGIDAQGKIIDSFKSQMEYIDTIQNTVSKLYKPEEIDNLVKVKVENEIIKEKETLKSNMVATTNIMKFLLGYSLRASSYLTNGQHDWIVQRLSTIDDDTLKTINEFREDIKTTNISPLAQLAALANNKNET